MSRYPICIMSIAYLPICVWVLPSACYKYGLWPICITSIAYLCMSMAYLPICVWVLPSAWVLPLAYMYHEYCLFVYEYCLEFNLKEAGCVWHIPWHVSCLFVLWVLPIAYFRPMMEKSHSKRHGLSFCGGVGIFIELIVPQKWNYLHPW